MLSEDIVIYTVSSLNKIYFDCLELFCFYMNKLGFITRVGIIYFSEYNYKIESIDRYAEYLSTKYNVTVHIFESKYFKLPEHSFSKMCRLMLPMFYYDNNHIIVYSDIDMISLTREHIDTIAKTAANMPNSVIGFGQECLPYYHQGPEKGKWPLHLTSMHTETYAKLFGRYVCDSLEESIIQINNVLKNKYKCNVFNPNEQFSDESVLLEIVRQHNDVNFVNIKRTDALSAGYATFSPYNVYGRLCRFAMNNIYAFNCDLLINNFAEIHIPRQDSIRKTIIECLMSQENKNE